MNQDSEIINRSSDKESNIFFVVAKWFRLAVVAAINVIILGAFAAYFQDQRLEILEVIGIVADSIGIVTGLLGIWFFFLSERLNRTTSQNLDRTTAVVDDLRSQMWQMIQQTFNSFVKIEDKESAEKVEKALETLRDIKPDSSDEFIKAIDAVVQRLDILEKQREMSSFRNTKPDMPLKRRTPIYIAGDRVKHSSFGEGIVVSSKMVDNDEEVTVSFKKGVKRLLASFANLERLPNISKGANQIEEEDVPF